VVFAAVGIVFPARGVVGRQMTKLRFRGGAVLVAILSLAVAGCGEVRGDREVDTSPPGDEIGKAPGLFSGKKGALIFETDPWEGASPYGDTME